MSNGDKPIKRILMTCAAVDGGTGGVQVVFRDLVEWLARSDCKVDLVYQGPLRDIHLIQKANAWAYPSFHCAMPGPRVKGSALLGVPAFLAYSPIAFFHLVRLMRRQKIDVVNCHYLAPYFIHLILAARVLRIPVVVSVHGADVDAYADSGPIERFLLRQIMRSADRVVACSEAMARQTADAFPNIRSKVTYVHNGVDLSRYAVPALLEEAKRPFILCICRHVQKKGIDTLLQAFALVLREMPDLSLVLVGGGPLMDAHKALAATLGISGHVTFAGDVEHREVSAFLAGCSLFVLPSRTEPFGLVLLEAALYEKAIVCTRVGGVPEIVTHGVNGMLVDADDPDGMAHEIVHLMRHPEHARTLGAGARRVLENRFLWQDRVRDYIALFEGRMDRALPHPALEAARP